MDKYPKRLIEVDLPIKRISAHARREKSIRHGHICTLHIWWARRPLAACRAVICASLWPDPADELCPAEFRKTARELMTKWAKDHLKLMSEESSRRFIAISKDDSKLDDNVELRKALLDFTADFANWDNSTVPEFLKTSRTLTQAAHEALGGEPGSRPLVVDPFAGGGSIPLEALRVGADAFASDLNPVAVLLNKVVLEYIPKYGQRLADEVRKWGQWIKEQAEKELAEYYPKDPDGAMPIAYLWARTIQCEGPGCGAEVPMLRSLWLSQKSGQLAGLKLKIDAKKKTINTKIVLKPKNAEITDGTVRRSAVTCPICGYTTPRKNVEFQASKGQILQRLIAVVIRHSDGKRIYREPEVLDFKAYELAEKELDNLIEKDKERYSIDEELPYLRSIFNVRVYSIDTWGKLFNARQRLSILTLCDMVSKSLPRQLEEKGNLATGLRDAIQLLIAMCVDRVADYTSNICRWDLTQQRTINTFCRQALGMVWDYAENVPYAHTVGSWDSMLFSILKVIEHNASERETSGAVEQGSATELMLPEDSISMFFTDPPYYDAIPYANLSDFFLVLLKRSLPGRNFGFLENKLSPKTGEIVQLAERNKKYAHKTKEFFEEQMTCALEQARITVSPAGIGAIVFAHKETSSWEAMLNAVLRSGWVITASWPIDTEQAQRLRAQNSAALASSVHLICRPRENPDGSLRTTDIGDWRDVLAELPKRIHEWMPRLAEEGVVGADAIFACLGPALEIYSRYSSVEKASGEKVELKEYLKQVWAAVSREALKMIFEGADASGFEEDARLTAMWLWTLRTSRENGGISEDDEGKTKSIAGYDLEYDAARKIAQGLGAHLENLGHLVKIKGDTATLLSAGARTRYLFGKDAGEAPKGRKRKKIKQQKFDFMGELKEMAEESGDWAGDLSGRAGSTVLDQLHQSMILFGAGRGEALKRFLVEDGIGMNPLYWRLAQSLSALYPSGTDEKRWVDGVLARKKGLGF